MKSLLLSLAICSTAFAAQSQNSSLDSNELRTILHIVNERNYYRSLDTICRAQIETLNESIGLYSISLETCENQADNYELIILAKDEELEQTKTALNSEIKRGKFWKGLSKGLMIAIPLVFLSGLLI